MKFSVLISLYYREKPEFLRECLNSLRDQTRPADEIVMVFDGKITDELEQVVDEFKQYLPIQIFRLPENVGLGKALNYGIQHCSYEYIFRMDSDDIASPNRFELQAQYLIEHPEIALLGGQIAEFHTDPNQAHDTRIVPQSHAEIVAFAKKRNPFNHMSVAYKKSAVQQAGGYQHHAFMEDYNLWLRMLAQGAQTANLPNILVYARTNGNAMLQRRRGRDYIHSEWQLYQLKRQLNIQSALSAKAVFVMRALPRLLPSTLLKNVYHSLRNLMNRTPSLAHYLSIGVVLIILTVLTYLPIKQTEFLFSEKVLNSIFIAFLAYSLASVSVVTLLYFPGRQHALHVLRAVGVAYASIFAVSALLFITFSNSFVIFNGILASLFFLCDSLYRTRIPARMAYIPFGNAKNAHELPYTDWTELQSPNLPNTLIQAIVVDLHSPDLTPEWQKFLADATLNNIPVYHIRQIEESLTGRVKIRHMYENDLGSLLPSPAYMAVKRIMDNILIIISLPITLPLMLITAIAIKIESPYSSIFFTQKRIGQHGKEFTIYKFRSMIAEAEREGAKFAQIGDERITKIGHFLRRTRLDELPQFYNILRGEMSLIGPRPEQKVFVEQFEHSIPFYNYRHIVKPGLSGWAQVTQGYTANTDETQVKIEHDFYYIKNFSFLMDMVVLLKTVNIIIKGTGAR